MRGPTDAGPARDGRAATRPVDTGRGRRERTATAAFDPDRAGGGRPGPGRREFLAVGVGLLGVALTPKILRPAEQLTRRTIPVMGTLAEIAVPTRDPRGAQRAIDAAFHALRSVDAMMSRFRSDSEIGRVNLAAGSSLGAGRAPVVVSAETAQVLRTSLHWAHRSGGAFDPCIGRLVEEWKEPGRDTPIPAAGRFAGRHLFESLELDSDPWGASGARVRLHDPEAALDLGGIAKGFGVDLAALVLREHGIYRALVNAGGDLHALGTAPGGDPWVVGVRDPAHPDRVITTLEVEDRAVATSGDYLQGFDHGGRRYHHLIDPETGEPRLSAVRSLTITAPDCMTADAAATAAFGLPHEGASTLIARAASDALVAHIG